MIPCTRNTQNRQIQGTEIRHCQGLGGGGNGDWLLDGCGISSWGDEKVPELDRAGGCTTL